MVTFGGDGLKMWDQHSGKLNSTAGKKSGLEMLLSCVCVCVFLYVKRSPSSNRHAASNEAESTENVGKY